MTQPYLIPNPTVLGSDSCQATLYYPHADAEVPVVVGFDIDGFRDIAIQSVHHDYGRRSWGPDIMAELDELQLAELAAEVCRRLPWDKPRDVRDLPGYAPHPMHV